MSEQLYYAAGWCNPCKVEVSGLLIFQPSLVALALHRLLPATIRGKHGLEEPKVPYLLSLVSDEMFNGVDMGSS